MTDKTRSVLILGGGVSGMAAAKTLGNMGIDVHLVEKEGRLGGNAFHWACMATDECQYCGACISPGLASEIDNPDNINIYLSSEIAGVEKQDDKFKVSISGSSPETITAHSVLLTTGLTPFNPSSLATYAYNEHDNLITSVEFNLMLKTGAFPAMLSGKEAPKIAFIQCVGSRNREEGRGYCSQICCKTSVRHAGKIISLLPEAKITIFNIDLQVIGKEFRTQLARLSKNIELLQGVPGTIRAGEEDGKLVVIRADEKTGKRVAHDFDLIVLAVGILPSDTSNELANLFGIEPDEWGFFSNPENLPQGVYAAGAATGPTSILDAKAQGETAALKIAKDMSVLPGYDKNKAIAVLGGSDEAAALAKALVKNDYGVRFFGFDFNKNNKIDDPKIIQYPDFQITSVSGTCGDFTINAKSSGKKASVQVGAIIVADGRNFIPSGYEKDDKILTLKNFKKIFDKDKNSLPEKISFRLDHAGHEYKENARDCLNLAIELVQRGKSVFMIMEKMLVHGLYGQNLYDKARKAGVKFFRLGKNSGLSIDDSGDNLVLSFEEATLAQITINLDTDMLVIPEIAAPSSRTDALAKSLRQKKDKEGFIQAANVRHRPVASPRQGIFFVGSCHDEKGKDDLEKEINGVICGLKSVFANFTDSADFGEKPASYGPLPRINEGKCVKCLTCFRICEHGAIIIRNGIQPFIVEEACFDCGLCVANCPNIAIEREEAKDKFSENAKTVVFACERSANLAIKEMKENGMKTGDSVFVRPVRCAGSLDIIKILEPLSNGAKKVIVAGCHPGNCRSMTGADNAKAKIEAVNNENIAGNEILSYHGVAANEPAKINRIINE